ncbi:MAG: cache and HAMP domain-containing protein [Candidatus Thorarchaeota archaeon]
MATLTETRKKGSFKRNVIATSIVITVLSVAVTGFIALQFLDLMGVSAIGESSTALETQIRRHMNQTAVNNARVIDQKLANAEAMIRALAYECERILSPSSTYQPRAVYYDYFFEYAGPRPADTHYDARYGINISWNYSSWYAPGTTSSNYSAYESANAGRLGRISNLDYMFQAAHAQMPDFRWLYLAFARDGLFINYPGSIVGGTDTDRINEPYRPYLEEWYLQIRAGNGDVVFVEPYYDEIDGVLLISIGKAVYFRENNSLIGVISGDITIEDINQKILGVGILETGYAALVKRVVDPGPPPSEYVGVIAHREVPAEQYVAGLPPLSQVERNSDGTSALTQEQLDMLLAGGTGTFTYTRNGKQLVMAYAPIERGGYVCIIIAPMEEVLAAIPELQNTIRLNITRSILFILSITTLAVILAGIVTATVANQVTKPLQYLMDIALRNVSAIIRDKPLDTEDLRVDADYISKDDEIGELARAFQGMLDSIKGDEQ